MPLALNVEDGTNVANANSYATLAQLRSYNAQRGVKLPDSDDEVIALSSQAMDYLTVYEYRFSGKRTYGMLQRLAWPRLGVKAYGTIVGKNYVPQDIIDVQCYLAGVAATLDLYGNNDTRAVLKEVIGPIETDYSPTAGASTGPILPTVFAMLRPYLVAGSGMVRSVRK